MTIPELEVDIRCERCGGTGQIVYKERPHAMPVDPADVVVENCPVCRGTGERR